MRPAAGARPYRPALGPTILRMPKSQPGDKRAHSSSAILTESGDSSVAQYIRNLESQTLDYWLHAVASTASESSTIREMQSSVSWRVTRPLRIVRSLQVKAARIGYRRALRLAIERSRQFRWDKRRG